MNLSYRFSAVAVLGLQASSGSRACFVPSLCNRSTVMRKDHQFSRSFRSVWKNDMVAFDYSLNISQAATDIASGQPAVLFCGGFRSRMSGKKATALKDYCISNYIAYCRFDYRGHGESNGNFLDLTLSDWIQDAALMLNTVLALHNKVVVVGSSMGAWIALHLAILHPDRISGIVGVASAPDFFQDLYESATNEQRMLWKGQGIVYFPSRYDKGDYPISWKLIQDVQENWLLMDSSKPSIPVRCPVRLLHGQQDVDIAWEKSLQLAKLLTSDDVVLTLIKSGDHRLSEPPDLKRIATTLRDLIRYSDMGDVP